MTSSVTVPAHVPVLIAGGGPSGLAAAIELGRRGIDVFVVEPRAHLDPLRPRAKTTSVRTMEHFRRWGLAESLRAAAPLPVEYAQDVVFCTGLFGHEIVRFTDAFGLTTGRSELFAEPGQQAPQPVVEQILREAAGRQPSVTVATGWRVDSVVDGMDCARAVLEDPSGGRHDVVADYLLGCDGSSGITRKSIGARYEGSTGSLPNVSITFRSAALETREMCALGVHYWVIGAAHGGLMGRLDLQGTWWAIVQGVDASKEDVDPASLVTSLVGSDIDVDVLAIDPWSARMLLVDRYRGHRVFLVGDAAHLNPPWGGHGFNTCIGDAVNLGWKLAAVLTGWAPGSLLDSYEAERRPVAQRTISAAGAQEAFTATAFVSGDLDADDEAGQQVRAALAKALQVKDSEFHSLGLVLGYDYPGSPIVVHDIRPVPDPELATFTPSAHAGARLPHTWLPDGRSIYDILGPEFTLLRLAPGATDDLVDVAAGAGVPLRVVELDLPALRELYESNLVLVRPDQHIAWRGEVIDRPADLLARVIGVTADTGDALPAAVREEPVGNVA